MGQESSGNLHCVMRFCQRQVNLEGQFKWTKLIY